MMIGAANAKRVLDLLRKLDLYAEQKLKVGSGLTRENQAHFPLENVMKIRLAIDANRGILDQYLVDNADNLDRSDAQLIASWRFAIRTNFTVVRALKSGCILSGNDGKYYQVLGLNQPFEEVVHGRLPAFILTTLLPFGDKITYDGMVSTYPVFIGGGMRRNFNDEYSYARRHGQIITTLLPESAEPAPVKSAVPTACEHRSAVRSLADKADKLRGGGTRPLHSPALAMLRWSTALAASCLEDKPDVDHIRKQLGQISKAFKQIDRVIWEGQV